MSFLFNRDRTGFPLWHRVGNRLIEGYKYGTIHQAGKFVGHSVNYLKRKREESMAPYGNSRRRITPPTSITTSSVATLPFSNTSSRSRGRSRTRSNRSTVRAMSVDTSRYRRRARKFVKAPRRVTSGNAFRVSAGGFRRPKRVGRSAFFTKYGVVSKQEYGSSISDPEAIYLGHGIARYHLKEHLCRQIVKLVMVKAGIVVRAFSDNLNFDANQSMYFEIKYFVTNTATTSSTATSSTWAGTTFQSIANTLLTTMSAVQEGKAEPVIWGKLILFEVNAGQRFNKAELNMQQLHLNFEFNSQLKVQNVTEANTGTGANDDLVTSVEANPLVGKHYGRSKWQNGFDMHWRPGTALQWDGFYANVLTGVIATTYTDIGADEFKKPPPPFAFQSTRAAGIKVQPGEIKTSFIKFKTHIMWQNLYNKVYRAFNQTLPVGPIDFGQCKLIGLEKLLDSRLESDSNVTCQYELTQRMASSVKEIMQGTLPYVEIL